jgi:hypothetical protein
VALYPWEWIMREDFGANVKPAADSLGHVFDSSIFHIGSRNRAPCA